jgi:large subunit ribosomal protein L4
MEAKVYNKTGKESGTITLPESIFGLKWNADLVDQVVKSMQSNARVAIADSKDRAEVRGGGKKPWRQKGTGRARHGSRRSPIWVGGGVTHGPTSDQNYGRKINKKMRVKALYTVLSAKLRDGEICFIDDLSFKAPKTKDALGTVTALSKLKGLEKIAYKRGSRALFALPVADEATVKSFRNIGSTKVVNTIELNPVDILTYKYLVISAPEESLKTLVAKVK